MISLIAAIDENNAIGFNNKLLCHLPRDLRNFKQLTIGHPIVMGRKTYQSIGKPLSKRENIVLSSSLPLQAGITIFKDMISLRKYIFDKNIIIIGGSGVYQEFLPQADVLYLTVIHHKFLADSYFPKITWCNWDISSKNTVPKDLDNPFDLTFYKLISKTSK